MRYIVIEDNPRNPAKPNIKTFATRRGAVSHVNHSSNDCSVWMVGTNLIPQEVPSAGLGHVTKDESTSQH